MVVVPVPVPVPAPVLAQLPAVRLAVVNAALPLTLYPLPRQALSDSQHR